ncbi:hypothetical protein KY284_026323 [Solanum tuberosum]|nr:hypothetical protein KY284_026323 [Solanum tuberosum]
MPRVRLGPTMVLECQPRLGVGSGHDMTNIKTLAMQFLEAFSSWKAMTMEKKVEPPSNLNLREEFDMQHEPLTQNRMANSLDKPFQETGESSKLLKIVDAKHSMRIQKIYDVELVSTNMLETR